MSYMPPSDIWESDKSLNFNDPIDKTDPRYVPTDSGRGDFSFNSLFKTLGIEPSTQILKIPPERKYIIFCGHRGCGKSTEMKSLATDMNKKDLFLIVFIDVLKELDINNLHYADTLMAVAKKLVEELQEDSIDIDQVFLTNLKSWFDEKIEKDEKTRDFALDVSAGTKGKSGIPLILEIFGKITSTFKYNSSHKEELRRIIKNSFSQFADAFNTLVAGVEVKIRELGRGQKILFVVDGTDRLSDEDSKRFFINDSHQLKQINANFMYCAPISLLYEGNQVQQIFQHFVLPMIKIEKERKGAKFDEGYKVLREIILRRVDKDLFDSEETIDEIICCSGGSPRELLKIVHYAFLRSESGKYDAASVVKAVSDLATDYKRFLETKDYEILYNFDNTGNHDGDAERVRFLLYNLALLEYNSFWRSAHPVIRLLDGYKNLSCNAQK